MRTLIMLSKLQLIFSITITLTIVKKDKYEAFIMWFILPATLYEFNEF